VRLDGLLADLGAVYEQQGKTEAAVSAYRKYVELSIQTAAKERGERRIAELQQRIPTPDGAK
jgi:hypothetical protein